MGLKQRILAISCCSLLCGCAESLYLTSPVPLTDTTEKKAKDYVFIAPYFADVTSRLTVSIVKGTPDKNSGQAGPPVLTIGVMPVPLTRSYLYMSRNGLFSNTANVTVAGDGMLSSSDTASTQQVTASLTELAQAAAALLEASASFLGEGEKPAGPSPVWTQRAADRAMCQSAIGELITSTPYFVNVDRIQADQDLTTITYKTTVDHKDKFLGVTFALHLELPVALSGPQADVTRSGNGIIAYFPYPAIATLTCRVDDRPAIALTAPLMLNLYKDRELIEPERDFLTGPQDTLTFSEGFLTGHKFSNQSGVKTIIDTVTAPIRALMPSVSITTQTQVQTGGGKPDQTTTTTSTQTGPPKSGP